MVIGQLTLTLFKKEYRARICRCQGCQDAPSDETVPRGLEVYARGLGPRLHQALRLLASAGAVRKENSRGW